jgi:hypothetical protein
VDHIRSARRQRVDRREPRFQRIVQRRRRGSGIVDTRNLCLRGRENDPGTGALALDLRKDRERASAREIEQNVQALSDGQRKTGVGHRMHGMTVDRDDFPAQAPEVDPELGRRGGIDDPQPNPC